MPVSTISEIRQYLTFKLGEELFALDVSKVREILEYSSITKVPQTPEFMRGIINLRGSVVSVVDLRLKLGMTCTERTINTCIIVVEVTLEGEPTILGALADSVQEVFELDPSQIEPPPKIGTGLNIAFIEGVGKHQDDFILILDIDKVFSVEELTTIHDAEGASQEASLAVAEVE